MMLIVEGFRLLPRCLQMSGAWFCKPMSSNWSYEWFTSTPSVLDAGWHWVANPGQATAHVSMVCILCYRGQGVGSTVVKHLLETPAAMTTDVYLVTLGRSIPFYKKAGFSLVPVRQIPRCVLSCSFARSFLNYSFIHIGVLPLAPTYRHAWCFFWQLVITCIQQQGGCMLVKCCLPTQVHRLHRLMTRLIPSVLWLTLSAHCQTWQQLLTQHHEHVSGLYTNKPLGMCMMNI